MKIVRPGTLEDYISLEANSSFWDRMLGFTFSCDWFADPARNDSAASSAFWESYIGRNRRIDPGSKNWCSFLLKNEDGGIIGRFFCAGIDLTYRDYLLSDACKSGLFPISWSKLMVPDPSHTETGQHAIVQIFADLTHIETARCLIQIATLIADLFAIETLLSQTICTADDRSGSELAYLSGYEWVRSIPTSLKDLNGEPIHHEIWAWKRDHQRIQPTPPLFSRLQLPMGVIQALGTFYQSLPLVERQALNLYLQGYDRPSIGRSLNRSLQRIDQLSGKIRDKLLVACDSSELSMVYGGHSTTHLSSLLIPISEALRRLAWFYGEFSLLTVLSPE